MTDKAESEAAPLARLLWYAKREAVEIGRGEVAALLDSALLFLCSLGGTSASSSRHWPTEEAMSSNLSDLDRGRRSK